MSFGFSNLTRRVDDYVTANSLREPPLLARLRQETGRSMQISSEHGQFMALLVKLMGAKRCIEVGTYTGTSSLWIALALPPDGRLLCCDVNPVTTAVARRYWREAGVEDKIELRLAPAGETLTALIEGGGSGTYDFAFVDADKGGYDGYYELLLRLLRPGGLIVFDNMLWGGAVAEASGGGDTQALRRLNRKLFEDERIDISLLPVADGVTLARKR